ncbi:zwei Ig domain protein zig-8-like [Portunus trituberculatus]|uniref:zwei Ig domain protein zig-8-like n=1 Tax=Portunus trituberculatus TaxID=210409 RepID=UPI001E1D1823|nr:zwei Ig domain protein zig-8-like [Portunus trituberculatus]
MTGVQAWAVWCVLTLVSSGVRVVAPPAHVPQTVNAPSALHPPQEHKPSWRSDKTSNSGSVNKPRVSLSDSSSSPVEPIKPLLDLSLGDPSCSLTVPLHPVFDEAAPYNVSAMTGNTAYLHCLVHNLGNKSVSWIRQRDLHIMTVGRYTYTTDQRFEVIHSPGSKDWILKIKYAQVRDSGNYECQVSTKPVRTYVVHLNIFEPQAEIIGAPDIHVDMGSAINLTCVISHSPEPPAYIFWYHNGKVMSYDSPRGGVTVMTDHGNSTTGYLLIQDAQTSDTGNYTCAPSNTAAASIGVHVLNGETPAAMQTNGVESLLTRPRVVLLLALLSLLAADPPLSFSAGFKGVAALAGVWKGLSSFVSWSLPAHSSRSVFT